MAGLIVLAGPTASGKSALALALAERLDGHIVNADSMQLYRELPVLSAQPDAAERARVPHRLYGVQTADRPGSVGSWLTQAESMLAEAAAAGAWAIVVGGTGLYLSALLRGLAPLPDIPLALRHDLRAWAGDRASDALHRELALRDPLTAGGLRVSDRQRILRALEVHAATGTPLALWQTRKPRRIALPRPRLGLALDPPREMLAERIAGRLRAMAANGALEEVEDLRRRGLARDLPAMKALAVPELIAHLDGRIGLDEALARAAIRTRQYAKRQRTWLRHRLPDLPRVAAFGDDLAPRVAAADDPLAALPFAHLAAHAPEVPEPMTAGLSGGDGLR